MDLSMFTSGMPCCRYLLIRIKHEQEACCFTKYMVSTLRAAGMQASDICGALAVVSTTLPFSHPLMGYDFYSFPGVSADVSAEEFVEAVLADDKVACFSHCYEYCKSLDKSTKFCNLCPLSKYYSNAYLLEERKLVRFAMESENNLSYLLSKGVKSSLFESVIDIHSSMQLEPGVVENPFLLTISKLIWQYVSERKGNDFYDKSYADRCSLVSSYVLDLFIGKYAKVMKTTSSISETVCAVQVENYFESALCSAAEVDEMLSSMQKKDVGKKEKPLATSAVKSNVTNSNIYDFFTKEQLSPEGLKPEDGAGDESEKVVPPTEDSNHEAEAVSFEVPKDESVGEVSEMVPVKTNSSEGAEEEKETSYDETADDLSYRELGYVYRASSVLYDKSEKEGFFGLPIVKKRELEHFSFYLDDGDQVKISKFYLHAKEDKRLAVELVVLDDKKTLFLLIYSPKLHGYFHTDFKSVYVKDMFSQLLSIPSIVKYCYYPYFLASFLMKQGIYVKGLHSLFSLSSIVYGQHNLLIDECLENLGAYKAEGGVHVKPKGEMVSIPLLYMHCYHQVYQKHSKELVAKGLIKELEERNRFDILLGRFYYQDLYAKKKSTLFTLKDSVGYHFLNEELEYKESGYLLTYSFKHLPIQLAHLLRELLCRMESKGYFKKFRVMITGMGISSFSLFVVREDMRKLDTLIDTTLVFFLRDNGLYGVRYSLNRKLISVPEKGEEIKK